MKRRKREIGRGKEWKFRSVREFVSRMQISRERERSKEMEMNQGERERESTCVYLCTVDGQSRGKTRATGGVARHAGVLPGVTGRHSVNSEQADTPAGRDRYIGIIVGDRLAVQGPLDLYRRIALQHGAGCGDRVPPVSRSLADHERSYLGRN